MDPVKGRILRRGSPEAEALAAGPEELLAAARAEARGIREEAEREAVEQRAAASAECGQLRAAALEEGRAAARAERAAALLREAGERERALAALEPLALEAGLEVARRILRRELAGSPEALRALAAEALRSAAGRGGATLRVSPVDLAALERDAGPLRELLGGAPLELSPDTALRPGDLVLELAGGRIDARVEAQLEPFRRAFLGGDA
jgi:flagellar assembly protein FliH